MTQEEFAIVVDRWYDPLYRFALSLCGKPQDALDLTQNAFRKLACNSKKLRDPSKAKPWLFSTVHREFIDDYRHEQRFPKSQFDANLTIADENAPAPKGISLDAKQAVEALSQLDERFRAPISLFYLEDFSYKEIAEMLDLPIGTVMSRLRRAKDHLRKVIEKPAQARSADTIPFSREA